jgi:fumarylacetoacetate (FAA) hydrolase
MKLGTWRNGTRDGELVVVSRNLERAVRVPAIAPTLQAALDDWKRAEPALREVAECLEQGPLEGEFAFDSSQAMAPLPRAYQWFDGGGYMPHMTLMRRSRGAPMPENAMTEPVFYQGNSDGFWSSTDSIDLSSEEWGIDLEGEIGVIVDDVPQAVDGAAAAGHIKLLVLMNDVSLRNLIPAELANQFGFFQSKPNKAFAPVAVTPDEAGELWDGEKLSVNIHAHVNDRKLGQPNAGVDFQFGFPTVISRATKSRRLGAGTIVGGGTVSNWDRSNGHVCICERRALEIVETGSATTSYMTFGDVVRIEAFASDGQSLFGAIRQSVRRHVGPI